MYKSSIRLRGKIVFDKVRMDPNFTRLPKTFQENEACFLYMSEGSFSFRTPTDLLEIRAGDAIVAKCGNYFIEPSAGKDRGADIIVFGAYFYPEMVKEFFQTDLKLVPFQQNFGVNPTRVEPLMKIFIESIDYLIENPDVADEDLVQAKLKELLLLLGKTEASIHDFINALFTPFEYDFREIIGQNTLASLSLAEIARLCGCSLATFKRRFDKYYDQPPAQYFLHQKIKKSLELLSFESKAISELAFECGFESVNHFNKAFKKHIGVSPTNYRLSQKDDHLSR